MVTPVKRKREARTFVLAKLTKERETEFFSSLDSKWLNIEESHITMAKYGDVSGLKGQQPIRMIKAEIE